MESFIAKHPFPEPKYLLENSREQLLACRSDLQKDFPKCFLPSLSFSHPSIHPLIPQAFVKYCLPGTVPSAGATTVSQADKALGEHEVTG